MKKYTIILVIAFLLVALPAHADSLSDKLKGRILLQVEVNGEAWYIEPSIKERYYMGRPIEAFLLMRSLGVGITNNDLKKIPVADMNLSSPGDLDTDKDSFANMAEDAFGTDNDNSDTDNDGYTDREEVLNSHDPLGPGKFPIDISFAKSQRGKILLQVERNGEAWYVNPVDSKRYFLGRPDNAFSVMRSLGLGISNNDLNKIKIFTEDIDLGEKIELSWGYAKDNVYVYFRGQKLIGLDPRTFKVLGNGYAKDNKMIVKNYEQIFKQADTATFDYVTGDRGSFLRDQNYVYDFNENIITGADPNSYRYLKSFGVPYAVDVDNAFYAGAVIERADIESFRYLEEMGHAYALDKNNYYYEGQKINGLDMKTAVYVGGEAYMKDKSSVYYKSEVLEGVSPNNFILLPSHYAKNDYKVYYQNEEVVGADSATFEVVHGEYGKDVNHVYFKTNMIKGSDPSTFTVSKYKWWFAKDANNFYKNGELVDEVDHDAF